MNPTAALRPSPSKTLAAGGTAHQLAGASIAENTWRAYSGALRRLEEWLGGRPLSDPLLAAYLGHLFDAGVSPAVAGQVVASVRFRAHLAGIPSPAGEATTRVLAGFRRAGRARGRGPADGVRWEQADAAAALAANGGALAGLRDAAILAIASDALLRVSEVAALEFADVNPSDSTVTVRHSKTDPEGAGAVAYLGPATLKRIRTWTTAAGINSGPLFRRIAKGGRRVGERLTSRSVRAIIRARATAAGVAGRVSGHSLRVGAAQSLAAAGATLVEMQQAGRWRSPAMPGLYVRGQLAARGAVARLRYGATGDQGSKNTGTN